MSREDAEIILKANKEMEKIWTAADADGSVFDAACRPLLKIMSREISKQKRRLGGSFAVAHAVVTRYARASNFWGPCFFSNPRILMAEYSLPHLVH